MRIVHVQHPYLPGLGYQENYLPFHQADLGHEVHLISSKRVPPKFRDQYKENQMGDSYEKDGVHIHRLDCCFVAKSVEDVLLNNLLKILSRISPDILHSHGLLTMKTIQTLYYKVQNKSSTGLFIDMHRDNGNFDISTVQNRFFYNGFKLGVLPVLKRYTDCFLPVNPYSKELLINELDIKAANVKLLPLGVDENEFSPNPQARRAIRKDLDLEPRDTLLIFAGHIEQTKRLTDAIDALGGLNDDLLSETAFLIIGSGDDEYIDLLRSRAIEVGVSGNIEFRGFVNHNMLSKYFNAADVGLWTGKLGITVLEAVSCGLPVIVSNDSATAFVVSNDNGLTFTEGNINELSDKVERYILEQKLRNKHGNRGRQLVEERLSWKEIAAKSIEHYRSNRE